MLIILTFLAFLLFEVQKSVYFYVLKVNSPTEIVIDINKNGIEDSNEKIILKNIQSFSAKPSEKQSKLAGKLKISQEDALGLGFLAGNFANETLLGKKIKWDAKNSIIFIDSKNYENLLFNHGFAVKTDYGITPQLQKNIEKVRKLNLKIFNNKSHKYHKLNCKYGLMAHNSQILPVFQLPRDAKPCKFCFGNKQNTKGKRGKDASMRRGGEEWLIQNVKCPSTNFKTNSINIFLTDFTQILKPSSNCNTAICRTLVKEINSAQSSIDFAIYGYTKIPAIQQALENAQKRGVKIRFVYDLTNKNTNIYPDTLYLSRVLQNSKADASEDIMHDKFFIFDKKKVITGSANISNTDMSGFNSNAVILISSEKIANTYSQEFEQMFGGKFHKQKSKIQDREFEINNAGFQVYFSPHDKGINAVIALIDNAHKYIYVPAFLITHKQFTQSLIHASKRGVEVKIILDATNTHTSTSKLKLLRQNGILVKTENYAGKLHSKSLIIDDIYTVIGSMNFSRSGDGANDENLLIIKNKDIALFYKTFFQYLWKRIPDKWLKYNARAESPDSIGSCSDGIDNDFDEKIDKLDDSCRANGKK